MNTPSQERSLKRGAPTRMPYCNPPVDTAKKVARCGKTNQTLSGAHFGLQPVGDLGLLPGMDGDREGSSRRPLGDDEIERILHETCGAWGQRSLEETDALIRERRLADWGEEVR